MHPYAFHGRNGIRTSGATPFKRAAHVADCVIFFSLKINANIFPHYLHNKNSQTKNIYCREYVCTPLESDDIYMFIFLTHFS